MSERDLEPYLRQILRLPFVRDVRVQKLIRPGSKHQPDALIVIETPTGLVQMIVEVKRSHLSREVGEHLVHLAARDPNLLVLAPTVGRDLGELFTRERINFMDLAGNCHLRIDDRYVSRIQGLRGERQSVADKGMRAPAYRVLFALLTEPSLATAPVRAVAKAAGGVSAQTVASLRAHLLDRGLLVRSRGTQRWAPAGEKAALDLFIAGFTTTLLPGLVIGRFRAKERDVMRVEVELTQSLSREDVEWRWGGGAACQRLTRHFRGDRTVVYVDRGNIGLAARLKLAPEAGGPIVLALRPGPLAFESPQKETVHPLLAYADLLAEGDERAREGASEIYDRYLSRAEES